MRWREADPAPPVRFLRERRRRTRRSEQTSQHRIDDSRTDRDVGHGIPFARHEPAAACKPLVEPVDAGTKDGERGNSRPGERAQPHPSNASTVAQGSSRPAAIHNPHQSPTAPRIKMAWLARRRPP